MATKLAKSTFPDKHAPEDFKCFGPPALKDGEFDNVKIADLGCFNQQKVDSNKFYHGAIVQSKINGHWYVYFEWGRTGGTPSFQFVQCHSEAEAQEEFCKQLHEKNDKRGVWVKVANVDTLTAKPGKDVYLVRPQATRSTGLPDAKTIKINEGAKKNGTPTPTAITKGPTVDLQTVRLLHDLNVATVSYTKGSMADASLPTQQAIDESRNLLIEAQKRLEVIGTSVAAQVSDGDLVNITSVLYSRIPKKKALHCPPEQWILNTTNIAAWQQDLDAFESALYATDIEEGTSDPYNGMPLTMRWIDPKSALGMFLYGWWPRATANRHAGIGPVHIKNLWQVDRIGDQERLEAAQERILRERPCITERPLFQPRERQDLRDAALAKRYWGTNTALLHHGSRSCNVAGLLRTSFKQPRELVGVVITGAMFSSNAVCYTADDILKSVGYTSHARSYWSRGGGGIQGRGAFMLECDVVCGRPFVAPGPHPYVCPPQGHHCVFGKGGHSQVLNNEWVIFNKDQVRIRYLVEFAA